ncbi:amidase signature domain-containing protein [Peziza echinospora]|nr:amidase signature domain-containing protein [Peziza echinospora]
MEVTYTQEVPNATNPSWQEISQAKVDKTLDKILLGWRLSTEVLAAARQQRILNGSFFDRLLTDKERQITKLGSLDLVEKIAFGGYSATEVTRAYAKAAAVAHQIESDIALSRATELDDYFIKYKKTIGPLHGLPVSLKDQSHVKDTDTTMGYVGWIGTCEGSKDPTKVHKVKSQVMKELLSLGAVLYCKTSLLQTLLTLNPVNQNLFCGGSSGESGLTHMFIVCGINGNLNSCNQAGLKFGSLHTAMAQRSRSCEKIFFTDGVVEPQPPIRRGLRNIVEVLRNTGHKIFDWNPPPQSTAKPIHLAFLLADGAHDVYTQINLSGEPLILELAKSFQLRDPICLLEYQQLAIEGRDYAAAYSDYWNETCNHGDDAYTGCINLMSYSAAVIPVTHADETLDPFDTTYVPQNEQDILNWEAYDPEIYHGAPVGAHIVASKYEEEKV